MKRTAPGRSGDGSALIPRGRFASTTSTARPPRRPKATKTTSLNLSSEPPQTLMTDPIHVTIRLLNGDLDKPLQWAKRRELDPPPKEDLEKTWSSEEDAQTTYPGRIKLARAILEKGLDDRANLEDAEQMFDRLTALSEKFRRRADEYREDRPFCADVLADAAVDVENLYCYDEKTNRAEAPTG